MPSPLDELRAEMESAVLKAHRAGMRYDAIRAEVATVGDRVHMAQRAQVLDHERRDEMQPRLTGQQLAQLPRGRKDVLRVGYKPMAALVDAVMPGRGHDRDARNDVPRHKGKHVVDAAIEMAMNNRRPE